MTHNKDESEYFDVLTTIRMDTKTDQKMKAAAKILNISQANFIRHAIRELAQTTQNKIRKQIAETGSSDAGGIG